MKRIINRVCTSVLLMSAMLSINAQENLNREIEVFKPYSPEVSDFNKINDLPDLTDTTRFRTSFDYSIQSTIAQVGNSMLFTDPVKLNAPEYRPGYNGYIKAGFGNYSSPLADAYYSVVEPQNYDVVVRMFHNSSRGDVTMSDGNDVNAKIGKTNLGVAYNQFIHRSVLYSSADLDYTSWNYYGYNPASLMRLDPDQYLINPKLNIGYKKNVTSGLLYDINLRYEYGGDKFDVSEHDINLEGDLGYAKNRTSFGVGTHFRYVAISAPDLYLTLNGLPYAFDDKTGTTHFSVTPYFSYIGDVVEINAALRLHYDKHYIFDSEFELMPNIDFLFKTSNNNLNVYANVKKTDIINTYTSMLNSVRYLMPKVVAPITMATDFGGGIMGNSSQFQYRIGFDYYKYENQLFWATLADEGMYLTPMIDDANLIKVSGDVSYRYMDNLAMKLSFGYYKWDPSTLTEAWQTYPWDANFEINYNARKKFYVTLSLNAIGPRKTTYTDPISSLNAKAFKDPKLSSFFDVGAQLEYRFTDSFSIFVMGKNLFNDKYELWNNYPVYGTQVYGGLTFSF